MKRMLFNATQAEELRVAIVDGQKLVDLDIESAGKEQRKSNIYKAVITRVEPSLEAVFVDYGAERHGFLPFKEIAKQYMVNDGGEFGRSKMATHLKVGHEMIVQVDKDERGNKGAALTTYISLAGRYLVLMPNNPRGGGVSRRIEGEDRNELREVMDQLQVPDGMSLIARTAGIGRTAEEMQWDLNYLLQLWKAIEGAAAEEKAPCLIYLESSLVVRAIRDLFQPDIGEILVDTPAIFEQAHSFMSTVMPANVNKVKLYKDDIPLFSRFQIEHQIESAYRRDVTLPSGGVIVIDHTEAMVAIDVNSARATRGHDIEQTAFHTNLEAAEEVARQLRLRDLGGLIVVDFIDMESAKNQREVENRLRDSLKQDRARVQIGKISRFGLLELSRQRLQPSLEETTHTACPRCHGTGYIRDTASTALHVLRILQEEAMKENTAAIHAQVPVDVATYLLNEKRSEIFKVETRLKVNVLLIPNPKLETPNYLVERLRHDSPQLDAQTPSYEMVTVPAEEPVAMPSHAQEPKAPRPEPLVKGITPDMPAPMASAQQPEPVQRPARPHAPAAAPVAAPAEKAGFLGKLFGWLKKPAEPVARPVAAASAAAPETRGDREPQRGREPRRDREDQRRRGEGRDGRGGRDEQRRGEGRGRHDREEQRGEGRRQERQEGRRGEQQQRSERGDQQRNERGEQQRREQRPPRDESRRDEGRRDEGRREGRRDEQPREPRRDEQREPTQPQRAQQPRAEDAPKLESHPSHEEGRDNGEGQGRGRRRRRGGRGRGPRDQQQAHGMEGASAADAIETRAAELESAREPAPVHEPVIESTEAVHPRHERERGSDMPPQHEPVAPVMHSQPVAFQVVSQHDEFVEEAHRPSRKRRHPAESQSAAEPALQMVETQAPAEPPVAEDELPRRTKPRRRRGASTAQAEPLQLVETTHASDADNAPTP